MKRVLVLSFVLVFAVGLSAHAAITPVILQQGDIIQYQGQATNESEGSGGAFNWKIVYDDTANGVSTPVGGTLQTFCTELNLYISSSMSVASPPISNLTIGSYLNTTGQTLQNTQGLYLFDLWSNGLLAPYFSSYGTKNVAGAVQVEIWLSEGYGTQAIANNGGISGNALTTAIADANYFVHNVLDGSTSWSNGWTPTDIAAVDLNAYPRGGPGQDQIVLVPSSGTFERRSA